MGALLAGRAASSNFNPNGVAPLNTTGPAVAAPYAPASAAPLNTTGPAAAAQHAPLTTWSEEVDTGTGDWDVLNNEEVSFYSPTDEESHDDWGHWEWGRGHDGWGNYYWRWH
eukprot:7179680-Prorocentrum_lima.AAC.1